MKLGITTIQRNRGPWIVQWLAFHLMVGFEHFFFYAHLCTDETISLLVKLQRHYHITILPLGDIETPQMIAYKNAIDTYASTVDWMAYIDGDEFLFPTKANTMQEALWPYNYLPVSAVGAYNVNFGSAGHIQEPDGLIVENYTRRANIEGFLPHRRVKSIVKGRQKISVSACSNVFVTPLGTVDEQMRPIHWGYIPENVPTYEQFRFNHYPCQSRAYYEKFKRFSGHADAAKNGAREEDWWECFNTNDEADASMDRFKQQLRATVAELTAAMEA